MSEWVRVLAFAAGLALIVVVAASVFFNLVVPRATSSFLLRSLSWSLARIIQPLLSGTRTYEAKDRAMSVVGPLALVLTFVVWLAALVVGFGLMGWWTGGGPLSHAFSVAGSSVFTLGFATNRQGTSQVLEFVAAGAGLLVIALEIAYLPTLYLAFSSRETQVTLLGTRAGVPAWGPEILARHHWFGLDDELPALFRTWEAWAAAVAESHTNYPTLMWFRSPVPWRSWLTALTAMLDAAALNDALRPSSAPRQGRQCLQMGTNCLRFLARASRLDYVSDPLPTTPIRLTFDEYMEGIERMRAVGYVFERSPEEAWPHFSGWRVNYEEIVDRLTVLLLPPPAPWFLPRTNMGETHFPRVIDRTPDDPHGKRSAEGGDEIGGNEPEGGPEDEPAEGRDRRDGEEKGARRLAP